MLGPDAPEPILAGCLDIPVEPKPILGELCIDDDLQHAVEHVGTPLEVEFDSPVVLGNCEHHLVQSQPFFVGESRPDLKRIVAQDELACGVLTYVDFGPEHLGGDELT